MKALTDKSRDELLKESRLLYQELNREFKQIEKSKTPLLKDAYSRFKQFKKDVRYNDLSKYSDKMIKDIYRDLKYIKSLKSSTLEGAEESARTFGVTKNFLESLSENKRQQFWDMYSRAYSNLRPDLVEKYKYEVFDVLTNEMVLGQDPEEIYAKIEEAFKRANELGESEEEMGELFAENLNLLFSEEFDDFFDEYF